MPRHIFVPAHGPNVAHKAHALDMVSSGFKKMYSKKGTPVFLLFQRGQEMGRMLGMADQERLEAFLDRNLPLCKQKEQEVKHGNDDRRTI